GVQSTASTADGRTPGPTRYEALRKDATASPPRLYFKRGPHAVDVALPYSYLCKVMTDGWSIIGLSFNMHWPGPMVVQIRGEHLGPVADAIIAGTAAAVEVFDSARHTD